VATLDSQEMLSSHAAMVNGRESSYSAEVSKGKGVYFYLQALSAKGWSPKREEG